MFRFDNKIMLKVMWMMTRIIWFITKIMKQIPQTVDFSKVSDF